MLIRDKNTVLRVVAGPGTGTEFALGKGRHVVGSGTSCALRIEHPSVAALHAMIVVGDDVLRVYPVQRSVQLGAVRGASSAEAGNLDEQNLSERDLKNTANDRRTVEVNGSAFEFNQQIIIGQACVEVIDASQERVESAAAVITKAALDPNTRTAKSAERSVRRRADRISSNKSNDTDGLSDDENPIADTGISVQADGAEQQDDPQTTAEHPLAGPSLTVYPDHPTKPFPHINSDGLSRHQLRKQNAAREVDRANAQTGAVGRAASRTMRGVATASVASAPRRSNNRALVPVAETGTRDKAEVIGLLADGAADVSANIKLGFSALWREGFGISKPLVIASFLVLAIGFILVVDRQTVAVNDPSVSPARSLSTELQLRNFGELEIGENSNNKIELNGFVATTEEKRQLDKLVKRTDENSTAVENVVVASELVDDVGSVLNEFGMAGLDRSYVGNGKLRIEGYVGPELDWDSVVSTLLSDFPSITNIDDSGVETLSVRLNDLKRMMLEGKIEKLSVKPKGSKIEVKGALPVKDINVWAGIVDKFRAKYGDQPIVIDEIKRVDPGTLPRLPIEGTIAANGVKKLVVPPGAMYAEGETMPDGVMVVRIEKHRVILQRDGYEYAQPYFSGGIAND